MKRLFGKLETCFGRSAAEAVEPLVQRGQGAASESIGNEVDTPVDNTLHAPDALQCEPLRTRKSVESEPDVYPRRENRRNEIQRKRERRPGRTAHHAHLLGHVGAVHTHPVEPRVFGRQRVGDFHDPRGALTHEKLHERLCRAVRETIRNHGAAKLS